MKELINEEKIQALVGHELFARISEWAHETGRLVKGFAHSKSCERRATSCPQNCCEYQLTEMSAVMWSTERLFRDIKTFTNISEGTTAIDKLLYLTRVHEILFQITHLFEFTDRASTHKSTNEDVPYFEKYWFWDKIQPISLEASGLRTELRILVGTVSEVTFI